MFKPNELTLESAVSPYKSTRLETKEVLVRASSETQCYVLDETLYPPLNIGSTQKARNDKRLKLLTGT